MKGDAGHVVLQVRRSNWVRIQRARLCGRPPTAVPRGPETSIHRRRIHRRQVFGLPGISAGWTSPTAVLLAIASQVFSDPVLMLTAVVPGHRCGAVPDSHRVPCCPAALAGSRPSARGDYPVAAGAATQLRPHQLGEWGSPIRSAPTSPRNRQSGTGPEPRHVRAADQGSPSARRRAATSSAETEPTKRASASCRSPAPSSSCRISSAVCSARPGTAR